MPREYEKCPDRTRRFVAHVRLRRPLLKGSRRMTGRIARTTQVGALVLALVLVPAALAAKGHGGGGSTGTGSGSSRISGPGIGTDTRGPPLSLGDLVTVNVSPSATTQPYVNL